MGSTYPTGHVHPPRNKCFIRPGLKGNQWLISPDHKALFLGGGTLWGGTLTSHDNSGNLRAVIKILVAWVKKKGMTNYLPSEPTLPENF